MTLLSMLGEALLLAAGMMWQVAWSLILGFTLSGLVQTLVSKERMQAVLGRDGIREIAIATGFGAASSSCSYAAAAMSKTLFKKGAALVPSLAFLFSSTNLVLELGIILWLLMGWQFTAAEWIGGVVLIAVMTILVRLTYPKALVEEARRHVDEPAVTITVRRNGAGLAARAVARSGDAPVGGAKCGDGFLDAPARFAHRVSHRRRAGRVRARRCVEGALSRRRPPGVRWWKTRSSVP